VGRACSTYGGQRRCIQDLLGRCDGKIHLEDLGLDGSINPLNAELNPTCHLLALIGARPVLHISRIKVNMHLQEAGWGGMDWIALASAKDRWRALVNAVLTLRAV
jgi:hypothetical protein